MKYIITEDQYNRVVNSPNRLWILRRFNLFRNALKRTLRDLDPCRFDDFNEYETVFYIYLMDDLHPEYYLIEDFDYDGIVEELKDLFYVDVTEAYHDGRKKC
jgi:hypothetical protein